MTLPKFVPGIALACLLLSAAAQAGPPGAGWTQAWSDEFNGSSIDGSKWSVSTGNRRDAVNTANALTVANGYLRIKTYTEGGTHYTGWIGSQGKMENCFGYWEARIRYNSSQGMWSAFWLQPSGINNVGDPAGNGTEIDIAEHRSRDSGGANLTNSMTMNVHWDGYGASHKSVGSTVGNPGANGASLQGNFHTYGLLWETGRYRFYIDGVETWSTTAAISQVRQWIYLTSEVDNGAWAGPTPGSYGDRNNSSTYQDIDYVRFYQRSEQTINGGFGSRMGPWRQSGSTSWDSNGGRGGSAGTRLNPSNTSGSRVEQTVVGLLPNTPYVVRGWGNVGSRTWPDIRFGARNYGGPEIYTSVWTDGFTAGDQVFNTGSSNTTANVFTWVPTQYGDCYADDISVRRAGRVTNGGFELGDTSHWAIYGDSFVHSWGGAFTRSGNSTFRLNGNSAVRGGEHAIYGLKPATTYTVSTWVKGDGQPIRLGAKNHGDVEAFTTVTGGGGTWTKGTHTFTTGAIDTSAAIFAYAPAGSNVAAVDLDDFLLLEALAPEWTSSKIGTGYPGEAGLSDGRVVVRGSGNNLSTTADGMQFVHQPMLGSGKITARLNSFEAYHDRAKGGLMLRASADADAPFAMVHWLPEGQCEFIWRNSTGGTATYIWASVGTTWPPRLRLLRAGSLVTASFSTDGTNWTQVGESQFIDLPETILAGLAVTSHETDSSSEAVFSNFSFSGDRDEDGIPDEYETNDGNFLSETQTGTDPDVPDTDGDGYLDGIELANGTNPLVPNTELIWQPAGTPGGTGAWDSVADSWSIGSGPSPWIPGKTALFGGAAGTVTVGSGVTGIGGMIFNTAGYTLDGTGSLAFSPEAFLTNTTGTTIISAPLAGTSTLTVTGGGQLQLRGDNRGFIGALVIDGNTQFRPYNATAGTVTGYEAGGADTTVEIRSGSQIRWFNPTSNATYAADFHLAGSGISGGNVGVLNLDASPARTFTLTGAILLDGAATIGSQNSGSFLIQGPVTGDYPLTFVQNAVTSTINGPLQVPQLIKTGAGTLAFGVASVPAVPLLTYQAGGLTFASGTSAGIGTIAMAANLPFDVAAGSLAIPSTLTGTSIVTKTGAGTLVLSGANAFGPAAGTYTFGALGTGNFGAIRLAHPQALGNHAKIRLNQWQGGVSTLELSGGHTFALGVETVGRNTAAGSVFLRNVDGTNTLQGDVSIVDAGGFYHLEALAGSALTINGNLGTTLNNLTARDLRFKGDGSMTLTGNLSDSTTAIPTRLNLTKEGNGTLTLGGNTTLLNPITLGGGSLLVNGTVTQAAINAAAGTKLGGTGTLASATVAGTLAPGQSVGTLNASGAVAVSGTWEIESGGASADRLNVAGTLNLTGASLDFHILAGGLTESSYVLATYGNLIGEGNVVLANLPFGYALDFHHGGLNQIALVRTASWFDLWTHSANLSGNDALYHSDPDRDGLANALEFLLGGNPLSADLGILPTAEKSGENFVFTFTRNKAAASEFGSVVEYTQDLEAPGWQVATEGMTQVQDHGTTETVTVTLPASSTTLFARLKSVPAE